MEIQDKMEELVAQNPMVLRAKSLEEAKMILIEAEQEFPLGNIDHLELEKMEDLEEDVRVIYDNTMISYHFIELGNNRFELAESGRWKVYIIIGNQDSGRRS
jgi:hypothetical protein